MPVEVDEAEVFRNANAVVLKSGIKLGFVSDDDVGILLADGE